MTETTIDKGALEALLPCPFCGGKADVYVLPGDKRGVQCDGCAARGGSYHSRTDAIAGWNLAATLLTSASNGNRREAL
jgi:hypothetical protein